MDKRLIRPLLGPALFVCLNFASAATSVAAADLAWEHLSAEQRQLLGRFQDDWETMSPERREQVAKGAQRWSRMTPPERALARQRLERWRSLSSAQRNRLRRRFERFKGLPAEQRARIRARHRWFQSLPSARRKALKEKWQHLTPSERRQRIEGLREMRSGLGRRREGRRMPPDPSPLLAEQQQAPHRDKAP